MRELKKALARIPILGRFLLILYRAKIGFSYFRGTLSNLFRWLLTSKETTNFTYDLDESNKRYLALIIADVTDDSFDLIETYIKEIDADSELRAHVSNSIIRSDMAFSADQEVHFGRRFGWYALARALKPKVVIETGVDKGLGSCVLTAALRRNVEEGHEGRYYGIDIDPAAGYLLSENYAKHGSMVYGDSIESLKRFDGMIDLFISDSDHSADYEAKEYHTVANKLSRRAVIIGDNSHATDKLLEFSLKTNRHFIFFQEKPKNHWYPGAGIGVSFGR